MADPAHRVEGDTAAAVDFLRQWQPTGRWVLTAIDPETRAIQTQSYRTDQVREATAWISWWQGKRNLYFTVNRVDGAPNKKPSKADIAEVVALHVDVDPPKVEGNHEDELRKIEARLRAFQPFPSIAVYSGGGMQAFWLLKKPLTDPELAEALNRGIELAVGGDKCHNVDRIMRLPGTVNVPDKRKAALGRKPALARLAWSDWGLKYDADKFRPSSVEREAAGTIAGAPIPRADLPEWAARVALHGRDPTGERSFGRDRSRAVLAVACAMVRAGWRDDEVAAALTDPANGISEHVREQGDPAAYAKRQAERARAFVGEGFAQGNNGRPLATQGNVLLALRRLGVELTHDVFSDRHLISGPGDEPTRHLDDASVRQLYLSIDARWGFRPSKDFFWDVVLNAAEHNPRHPVRDYLGELRWDGERRLDTWLARYGGAADTPYSRAVGAIALIAAVRRALRPGSKFDEMVVLESEQGTEKSTALETLAVRDEWFTDNLPLNAEDRQVIEVLRGKWIVEAAELKGMRRGEVEHLKAFLSRRIDRARAAYGRTTSEAPRQCVIFGTTNAAEYLRDSTGNRRFWPVKLGRFDVAALARDRDQLWAEAAAREAAGESIRLATRLWDAANSEQAERVIEDPWLDAIAAALGERRGKIPCRDIWAIVQVPQGMRTQDHNARLGECMKKLGWWRKKMSIEGSIVHSYVRGEGEEQGNTIRAERDHVGELHIRASDDVGRY